MSEPERSTLNPPQESSRWGLVVLVLVVLAGAGGAWWWQQAQAPVVTPAAPPAVTSAPPVAVEPPALPASEPASGPQNPVEALAPPDAALPTLAGSDDPIAQALGDLLDAQSGKAADVAAHVSSSAVELASLGESFQHSVQLFNASNEKLMDNLQRIESTVSQSMARSDEQLAYYVAQAREVIDLSITSQQGIVEDLRQLHQQRAAQAEAAL